MLLALTAVLAVAGTQHDSIFDTPKYHWVFEVQASFKKEGLAVGYDNGHQRGAWQPTRHDIALFFHYSATELQKHLTRLRALRDKLATDAPHTESANDDAAELTQTLTEMRTPHFREIVSYLAPVQEEFAPELKNFGASPRLLSEALAQYHRTIDTFQVLEPGSALKQFPDVPSNHWAAKAVLDLRSQGILHGYPDGTFKG